MIPGRQSSPSAWGYWLLSFMNNCDATGSGMATYWDLLYGEIELPNWLEPFVRIPEFARLRRCSALERCSFNLRTSVQRRDGRMHWCSVSCVHLCEGACLRYGTPGGSYFGGLLHDVATPPFRYR